MQRDTPRQGRSMRETPRPGARCGPDSQPVNTVAVGLADPARERRCFRLLAISAPALRSLILGVLLRRPDRTDGLCIRATFQATLQAVTPSILLSHLRNVWSDAHLRPLPNPQAPRNPLPRPSTSEWATS